MPNINKKYAGNAVSEKEKSLDVISHTLLLSFAICIFGAVPLLLIVGVGLKSFVLIKYKNERLIGIVYASATVVLSLVYMALTFGMRMD